MKLDAISNALAERLVELSQDDGGVKLEFSDKVGSSERIVVPTAALSTILTYRPKGPMSVMGTAEGEPREMKIEIRRNEVLLEVGQMDAAVGLSDLKDALARFAA